MDSKKDGQQSQNQKDKEDAKVKLAKNVFEARKKIIAGLTQQAHDLIFNQLSEDKEKLGGQSSIALLPGLFIITETHIIEGRAKKAEEYLTAAYWNFLRYNKFDEKEGQKGKQTAAQDKIDPKAYMQYKATLHKTFAKLYLLKRDYNEAKNEMQTAIYLDCLRYGPEHPTTSLGYHLMGRIFLEQGKVEQAQAFFGKFSQIWYKYLRNVMKKPAPQSEDHRNEQQLQLLQALTCLQHIQKHFQDRHPNQEGLNVFTPVMRTLYSMGMMYSRLGQQQLCRDYLRAVYKQCEMFLPKNDKKTQRVKEELQSLGSGVDDELSDDEGQEEAQAEVASQD